LAADLVPLPDAAWSDPEVRRTCIQLSVVWAVALAANAGLTLWMLSNLGVATFVLFKPLVSVTTTLPAIGTSVVLGRAVMRRSGTRLVGLTPPMPVVAPLVACAAA
jgi:hypothetical protein